jgi:hypothetical protein
LHSAIEKHIISISFCSDFEMERNHTCGTDCFQESLVSSGNEHDNPNSWTPNSKLKLLSSNVFACIDSPRPIFTWWASSQVKVCQFWKSNNELLKLLDRLLFAINRLMTPSFVFGEY